MKRLVLLCLLPVMMTLAACSDVPSGYVGVKVEKFGGERGVNIEVNGPGRYYLGWNTDMFLFPTFTQTVTWDKAGAGDESFTFQTVEGLSVNLDVGASFYIRPEKAAQVFQKYRKGAAEIEAFVLRAWVRDALTLAGAPMEIEDVYGKGRATLQAKVEREVQRIAAEAGIVVENVYFMGSMRLPPAVQASIDRKAAATQIAQQKENELRAAEADAAKKIAEAKGEAEATRIRGEALRTSPQALEQLALERWDGKLPQYIGAGAPMPFINLK